MRFFQTSQGQKKGLWHIQRDEDKKHISALCNCHGYWFGGYHNDKPELTKEAVERREYAGVEIEGINVCPSCIQQAYIGGLITVAAKY